MNTTQKNDCKTKGSKSETPKLAVRTSVRAGADGSRWHG